MWSLGNYEFKKVFIESEKLNKKGEPQKFPVEHAKCELLYTCLDKSVDICRVTRMGSRFKFHYPEFVRPVVGEENLYRPNATRSIHESEPSMHFNDFIPFLVDKVGATVASRAIRCLIGQ